MRIIDGGITAAKGFASASCAAGIKYSGRNDMAMKNRGKAEEIDTKALELLKEGTAGADKIYNKVLAALS